MEDVKRHLKEARDLIEKKEYGESIKLLKNVLKEDKNNYMALVLLGVALQDTEQAVLAYRKAIAVNKTKPLAWQGLASYYERNGKVCEELIQAYIFLCSTENDLQKYQEICSKISNVCKEANNLQYSIFLYDYVKTLEVSEKKDVCCKTLNKIVMNVSLRDDSETFKLIENIFELNQNDENSYDFCEKCFNYIFKIKGFDYVCNAYDSFIMSHVDTKFCDIIFKNYIIYYIESNIFYSRDKTHDDFIKKLLVKNKDSSPYSPFVNTLILFNEEEFYDAYSKIRNIPVNSDNISFFSIIIGNICLKLRRWLECEKIADHNTSQDNPIFQRRLLKIKCVSLCNQSNTKKCRSGLDILNDNKDDLDLDEIKALFTAYIYVNDKANAEECLSQLSNDVEYLRLKSLFLTSLNKYDESFAILNEHKESSTVCWLSIGKYYMERKEYDKVLLPLLKAAKYDKHDFRVFLYLGVYYTQYENNLEKAKKCYLKAFTLNPENESAGKCLSNTYRNLKDWDANYQFLKQLSSLENNQSSWTWLELGLHHFALEEWDAAIVNLRTYVRLQPNDVEPWESLADAYYSRGSFTSALKCYQRSIELDSSRKYAVVQIGAVQCLLGNYTEALNTFDSINEEFSPYIPSLKGLGDVYLAIAKDKLLHNLYGSCRDNGQKAINSISKALLCDHQFTCLWINLSTAVLIIAKLPMKYRWINIGSKFCNEQECDSEIILSNEDLFNFAVKCLCRAINLSSSNIHNDSICSLYYELANVYMDYYKFYGSTASVQKGYITIRNCIKMKQDNWQYWNLLGVICMTKDIKLYSVAQHSFLKALNLEFCNATVWSNLGVLYLFFGHVVLANKAFQKAQQFDPLYMQSWIGQALIAESIDHSDAMGLFLHASQLGFHRESTIGYAECVCNNLISRDVETLERVEYSMKNMHAIPIACDLMSWLIEYEDSNTFSLNVLGILQEQMGLMKSALINYEKALPLIQTEYKDIFFANYARALYFNGKYEEAVKTFKLIKEELIGNYCGLALCFNKLENYQEAYNLYGTAFQWLSNDDCEKGQLLVALASMAYKNGQIEESLTLFYQCIEQDSYISIPVLLAGFALGLLASDLNLIRVISGNLHKLNKKHEYTHYLALFQSYYFLENENTLCVIRKLQHFLHIFPNNSDLWRFLSYYCSIDSFAYPFNASQSAQKVISLDRSNTKNLVSSYNIASMAEACLGNLPQALKFAQKAIHLYPNKCENWILLVFACLSNKSNNRVWLCTIIKYIKSNLNINKSLQTWIDFCERHLHTLI